MRRTPSSTYRLQFNSDFTFESASKVLDYLVDLGISHIYCSPYLQAAPGSSHGYDVADFKSVNQELGGASAQEEFSRHVREHGLGQILDIVPNHMSISQNNPYWRDVLENGRTSRYADYFDMDWEPHEERLRNKVLLPLLADQYGIVLASGGIYLERNGARFEVVCDAARLPVAPASMASILADAATAMRSETLGFLADSLADLDGRTTEDEAAIHRTQRDKTVLMSLLTRYVSEKPDAFSAIDDAVAAVNEDKDRLDDFLQKQQYRLAYWTSANQDLGYRRFFDVDSLIGVRVEQYNVFLDTHELILQWLQGGVLDGVRVDHVDGLRDPQLYLEWLREQAPDAWILVEKILARNEDLPTDWPIAGTTGYDTLNILSGLLVSPAGLAELENIYATFVGSATDYPALVHEKKIAVMTDALGSDVNRLTSLFVQICEADRDHRDHSRADIRRAIREIAAHFSVYRTYVSPDRTQLTEVDAATINTAIDAAAQYRGDIDRRLFDFIGDVLLLRRAGKLESEFLLQFQQFTAPVMAKGFEDTALYCYNRLVGLNEVGSYPDSPVTTLEDFHSYNQRAQASHPERMVTLTTHDTKRSEDARARLLVLSEVPQRFARALSCWSEINAGYESDGFPDANTEYLYYQTLIGAWPLSVERALTYMEKATREAKQQTSWTQNNLQFEQGMHTFIRSTLADTRFTTCLESFVASIDQASRSNSLAQTLLKCTVPGVPDLYQGSELWDHRLVDPDNRGPVDFELRREMLTEMQSLTPKQIASKMDSGMPKLWTVQKALEVRRKYPECFGPAGDYQPLYAEGEKDANVVAFLRGEQIAVVVPRLSLDVANGWQGTSLTLPTGAWINVLSGDTVTGDAMPVEEILAGFPVALFTRGE